MNRSLLSVLEGIDRVRTSSNYTYDTETGSTITVGAVLSALRSFNDIVRYLNTRRSRGAILELTDEAAVQDVLFLMLRPWISDLVPENPSDRVANRFAIKDFVSQECRIVIEAKYVRNLEHGRSIVKELNDDIETYRYHSSCDDLVFFVYDPDGNIPDSAALERHLHSSRTYGARMLRCHAVIKP